MVEGAESFRICSGQQKMSKEELEKIAQEVASEDDEIKAIAFSSYSIGGDEIYKRLKLVEIYKMIGESISRGKSPIKVEQTQYYSFVYGSAEKILEDDNYLKEFVQLASELKYGVQDMVPIF